MSFTSDQEAESKWWGTCQNTYGEETKQLVYAKYMKLVPTHDGNSPYSFDMEGKTVLDIGGGPCSMLLKCRNLKSGYVIDPCSYPLWVSLRYSMAKIKYARCNGEDVGEFKVDEVWIYNVLQHCKDPKKIIQRATESAPVLRIFE